MKLLPRPEAVTGEVRCGHHKLRAKSDAVCFRPANHEGNCQFIQLLYELADLVAPQWENKGSDWTINPKTEYTSGFWRSPEGYKMDIDYGAGDSYSTYAVEDPDTGGMFNISPEQWEKIYRASMVGPVSVQRSTYECMVREILKRRSHE